MIAQYCISIDSFLAMIENFDYTAKAGLTHVNGLGSKIIESLDEFVSIKSNLDTLHELIKFVRIKNFQKIIVNEQMQDNFFFGKNLVFTGSLSSMSRSEAKQIAIRLGAKVQSSVSSNTDILIAGQDSGSKLKAAQDLGVSIMSEDEWRGSI